MTHDFTLTIVVDDTRSNASVTVGGDFDAACVEHFDAQVALLPDDLRSVTVDLSTCTIIDSAALGALIRLAESCETASATFETVVARPFQIELLRITGLEQFLGVRVDDFEH